jgi:hypothetical protein
LEKFNTENSDKVYLTLMDEFLGLIHTHIVNSKKSYEPVLVNLEVVGPGDVALRNPLCLRSCGIGREIESHKSFVCKLRPETF